MIGLSTTYYATQGASIYDSVKKIVGLGFDTVELGAAHFYEDDVWDTLKKIKAEYPSIKFTIHNLFPPLEQKVWFNPSDGVNEINKLIVDNLFASADILDAELVSIHPPILNEVTMGNKIVGNFREPLIGVQKDKEKSVRNFMLLMDHINNLAARYARNVAIENMDNINIRTFLATKRDFNEIFEKYKRTGMLLDVGHALLGGNLEELVSLNGNILELHLHDPGDISKRGKWAHLPVINEDYFCPIREVIRGKDIPIIFEHGADVLEEEILLEKKMLERNISEQKG